MFTKKALRTAVAVLAIAGLAACAKKGSSTNVAPGNEAADATVGAAAPVTGSVTFAGYTKEDGSAISQDEFNATAAGFSDLGGGVALIASATSATISGDTIELFDANGSIAVIKMDGKVVSSRSALPITAVAIESRSQDLGNGLSCNQNVMHFRLHEDRVEATAAGSASAAGLNVALVMACVAPTDAQVQGQAQAQGQSQAPAAQQQQQTQLPKEQPKQMPKEQPKQVPAQQPKQEQKQVPAQQPKEMPKQVPAQQPKEQPKQVPAQQPKEQPKQVPAQQPKEQPKQVPAQQPKEQPKQVPAQQPKQEQKQVPAQQPKEQPKQSPKDQPKTQQGQGQTGGGGTGPKVD